MVKQLKKPAGDGAASAAASGARAASVKLGGSGGVSTRKKCNVYVIFEGTASPSLRAAFAKRADWRDGAAAHEETSEETRPRGSASPPTTGWQRAAQNVRCHEALQRASGRGGVAFCWRHMAPKQPDTSSVVVNRWHGSESLTEKDRMLRALLAYHEARGLTRTLALALTLTLTLDPRPHPSLNPNPYPSPHPTTRRGASTPSARRTPRCCRSPSSCPPCTSRRAPYPPSRRGRASRRRTPRPPPRRSPACPPPGARATCGCSSPRAAAAARASGSARAFTRRRPNPNPAPTP